MQHPEHWCFVPTVQHCAQGWWKQWVSQSHKPHKPAINTLSSLYSSSLLSLSGFLIAFTFLFPLKFPKLLPSGYQKASWAPALRTDCLLPLMLWRVLALTSIAQVQVLPRAVGKLNKTFKIWSCVTAWTGNPVSRMDETWKCYRK